MRIAKWLSVIWVLLAMASVFVSIYFGITSAHIEQDNALVFVFAVGSVFAAFAAMVYGFNNRVLTRSSRLFVLKSLFPAICPNLYLVPFMMVLASTWGDWHDREFPLVWLSLATIVLLTVLAITVFGWIKRLPKAYLLALGVAGVAATVCHVSILISFTVVPCPDGMAGMGRVLLALASFFYAALPGLWASLACLLAMLFDASPRKKNAVPPRFAERLADATIEGGQSNPWA